MSARSKKVDGFGGDKSQSELMNMMANKSVQPSIFERNNN